MRVTEAPGFKSLMPTSKQMNRLLRDLAKDSEAVRLHFETAFEREKAKREEHLLRAEAQFEREVEERFSSTEPTTTTDLF